MKISAHFLVSTIDFYLLGCVSAETTNPTRFHWRLKTKFTYIYNRANKKSSRIQQGKQGNPLPQASNWIEVESASKSK
jgi:hypothetical protein